MIKILNVVLRRNEINVIVDWLWSEWGTKNNFNYWKSWVESSMFTDKIPQTFVAVENDKVLGTISLWRCDLQSRQDIFPWLGGLYVDGIYRKQGIGAALQKHAFEVAHNLGYKELYMFTELTGYFERFGWSYLEEIPNEFGEMVKLYRKDLI
jgi:GNAT superfamily N-acetyltransferase